MFGCEAISDWKVGSPLIWKGNFNGVELIAVRGDHKRRSNLKPMPRINGDRPQPSPRTPDLPENYLTVTCELSEKDGVYAAPSPPPRVTTIPSAKRPDRFKYSVDGGGWGPILPKPSKSRVEG